MAISPIFSSTCCDVEQPLLSWIDRHRHWLWAGIILLLLAGFNGQYRIGTDSTMYASTGRSLSQGLGYTYRGEANTVAFPGLPLLVWACYSVSADWGMTLLQIVMPLIGLAYLVLIYRLFLLHAGRPVAVLMACLVAVSYNTYTQFFEVLTDVPFSLGVVAALLGYEVIFQRHSFTANPRRCATVADPHSASAPIDSAVGAREQDQSATVLPVWWAWLVLGAGLTVATLMRPTVLALDLAILLTAAWQFVRGRSRGRHVALACLAVGVLVLFYLFDPRRQPGGYLGNRTYEAGIASLFTAWGQTLTRSITDFVPMLFETITTETTIGIELGTGIDTLFATMLLGTGLFLFFRNPLWSALIAANVAMMMMLNPHPRYFIPILPLLLYGLWRGAVGLAARLPQRYQGWPVFIVLLLLVGPNAVKTGKFIFEQHRTPFYAYYQGGRYASQIELGRVLNQSVDQDTLVLAQFGSELAFLSDRRVFTAAELAKHRTEAQIRQRLMTEPEIFVIQPTDALLSQWVESIPLPLGLPKLSVETEASKPDWTVHPVLRPFARYSFIKPDPGQRSR